LVGVAAGVPARHDALIQFHGRGQGGQGRPPPLRNPVGADISRFAADRQFFVNLVHSRFSA
jgi:hypothetical protein